MLIVFVELTNPQKPFVRKQRRIYTCGMKPYNDTVAEKMDFFFERQEVSNEYKKATRSWENLNSIDGEIGMFCSIISSKKVHHETV